MMFKFPLQRLLALKEQREKEQARQLASARNDAQEERDQRDSLARAHARAQEHIARAAGDIPTVGQLVSLSYTMSQLHERVSAADERAQAADKIVEQKHQELSSALQERQVLDRLRAKRLESHLTEEKSRDRVTMDQIAIDRFTSNKASTSREET